MRKNPGSNLEKLKWIYMSIGLMTSMSLTMVAIEWRFDSGYGNHGTHEITSLEDEDIQIVAMPSSLNMEVNQVINSPKKVKKSKSRKSKIVDIGPSNDSSEVETEVETEDIVFTNPDEMPSYPGGMSKMVNFINQSIIYPQMAIEYNIGGTVNIEFIVRRDGQITDIRVISGIGGGCDDESIRVVKTMSNWIPGKMDGRDVSVRYFLPIKFDLR